MRDFKDIKRIVIKVGTNTLSQGNMIDKAYVKKMVDQIYTLIENGKKVVIVTSGAIGMGAGRLGWNKQVKSIGRIVKHENEKRDYYECNTPNTISTSHRTKKKCQQGNDSYNKGFPA